MVRLIDNTSKDLIRKYLVIVHRIAQHKDSTSIGHNVIVAQMNAQEVVMLEGELKEIKIKMSLMGIPEPVVKGTRAASLNEFSNRYLKNDEST